MEWNKTEYSDIEIARIQAARLRPIELSAEEFAYEKKIGRYNPNHYTFQTSDNIDIPWPEVDKPVIKSVRKPPVEKPSQGQQLDLFFIEKSNVF